MILKISKILPAIAVPLMVFSILLSPAPVLGGGVNLSNQLQKAGQEAYGSQDLAAPSQDALAIMIGKVINAFLGLLGTVMLVLIIYGGFLYMTAQGNDEQVKKAKTIITNTVIGLIIIMAAYAIAGFVVSAVTSATSSE